MTSEVVALGWYVRFVPLAIMDAMSDYYARVIGLPQPLKWRKPNGDVENKDYFWGGEAIIVDHNYGGEDVPVAPGESDPATARQMEIFRVGDLDAAVAGLNERGAEIVSTGPCLHGREAFVRDPMGMLIGIRQRDDDSPLPQDSEGARRRRRGEAFNPGCAPMPEHWQELGWVRITVADLPGATRFYRDLLGLRIIATLDDLVLLDLGDNTTLELVGGGARRDPPPRQMASLTAMILRVSDLAPMVRSLREAKVHFVHDMYTSPKGDWTYIADPEGNVIGISERKHPKFYLGQYPVYTEDLEAARRWAETKAARANP